MKRGGIRSNFVQLALLLCLAVLLAANVSPQAENSSKVINLSVDPAQIQSVVTNLVLNATDAVGLRGVVKIETSRRDGWIVIRVRECKVRKKSTTSRIAAALVERQWRPA